MTSVKSPEALLALAINSLNKDSFAQNLNRWLHTLVYHDNTTILAYFRDETPRLLMIDSVTPEVHQDMKTVYLSGAYLLDPFYEVHSSGADADLYWIWDIAPDQFNRNQYSIEYYLRTTIVDEIAYVIWPTHQISVHVCLGRDKKSDRRFSIGERSAAKQVLPIVETLVCNHWEKLRFNSEERKENIIERMVRLVAETQNIYLTNRQAEVALLILKGHSTTSIGLRLGISAQTVKVFRKQLYKRCDVSSQAELFGLMFPLLSSQSDPLVF